MNGNEPIENILREGEREREKRGERSFTILSQSSTQYSNSVMTSMPRGAKISHTPILLSRVKRFNNVLTGGRSVKNGTKDNTKDNAADSPKKSKGSKGSKSKSSKESKESEEIKESKITFPSFPSPTLHDAYIIIKPQLEQLLAAFALSNNNTNNTTPAPASTRRSERAATTLLKQFIFYMNICISGRTPSNYHFDPPRHGKIYIPLHSYLNTDASITPEELVEKRIQTIVEFWETFDWDTASVFARWLARSLKIHNIDISNLFVIGADAPRLQYNNNFISLHINPPPIHPPHIKRIELADKSTITVLIDPLMVNYGLFVNLTTTFEDMGMSYNALHLYEHLMTRPWSNLSAKSLLYYNGSTFPTGLCYVYSIHTRPDSLKEYLNASVQWSVESRAEGGWEKHSEEIRTEVQRTISETRTDRTMTSMGRSDLHAYDCAYDLKIFYYWSNKPFDILITLPSEKLIDKVVDVAWMNELILNNPIRDVIRPKNITYRYMPLDVIKMRQNGGFFTERVDPELVKRKVMKKHFDTRAFYGIDCVMRSVDGDDLSRYNSVLFVLLFAGRSFTVDELNEYLRTHAVPFNPVEYPEAMMQMHNGWEWIRDVAEKAEM